MSGLTVDPTGGSLRSIANSPTAPGPRMIWAMKRAALALVLAACSTSTKDFPPLTEGGLPGGTSGGGGGTTADAGIGDGATTDGGVPIAGQVCLVQDLRAPTSKCDPARAGGLKVTLGTAGAVDGGTATVVGTATTGPDGSFSMIAPIGAGFTWHVTGANLQTSVMLYGTENIIPVMLAEQYLALRESNAMQAVDELHGAAVVRVLRGVSPVTGLSATVSPLADSETRYDSNNSVTDWNTGATQTGGVVWIPDAQLGMATITLSATDGTTNLVTTTVESQAITFVTRTIP